LLLSGEAECLRDRHLAFFRELVQRAEPELTKAGQVSWLNRLHREHENLRAALERCLSAPERSDQALELTAALFWFWLKRGYFREGQEYLERALSASARTSSVLRAKALKSLGSLTFFRGDFVRARVLLEESVTLGWAAGDLSGVGFSLGMMAVAALELGDIAEGVRIATEGQVAGRASATSWVQGPSLSCLAYVAMGEGDFDRAGRLHEEALELLRRQGEKWGMGIALFDLALLRVVQQRHAQPGLCAPRVLRSTKNSETGAASPVAWGFSQEPRQRTDMRYARPGSGAQWRVCSRASAHRFKASTTNGLAIGTSTP
jgi:tetratricopeptide (TPR) repeat protein